jgi:hypothetical protein
MKASSFRDCRRSHGLILTGIGCGQMSLRWWPQDVSLSPQRLPLFSQLTLANIQLISLTKRQDAKTYFVL